MIIYCFWSTLFRLAKQAAKTKDPEDIRKHKEYENLCLRDSVKML